MLHNSSNFFATFACVWFACRLPPLYSRYHIECLGDLIFDSQRLKVAETAKMRSIGVLVGVTLALAAVTAIVAAEDNAIRGTVMLEPASSPDSQYWHATFLLGGVGGPASGSFVPDRKSGNGWCVSKAKRVCAPIRRSSVVLCSGAFSTCLRTTQLMTSGSLARCALRVRFHAGNAVQCLRLVTWKAA